ncbi:FHA domain-containing protein [Bradyrhizobium sp.]|uniref:FHA domain-containing protein n=1 Tax=Bradyrhizobium sp. TaxID=376 RepID=UPI00403831B8
MFGKSGEVPSAEPHSRRRGAEDDSAANEKTVRIDRPRSQRLSWPARNEPAARAVAEPDASNDLHEQPTRIVGARVPRDESRRMLRRPDNAVEHTAPPPADEVTRLVSPSQAAANDVDPVVGWLVVIAGPGRGRAVEIGAGANPLGRALGQKLRLDFGDMQISRERHAVIIYDPRSQRFFLNKGEVRNLTYVDNEVVMAPVELAGGETILVGETQLRFVRFCGDRFNWS